jgi:tetratricopeptide (TPR) repeat protein
LFEEAAEAARTLQDRALELRHTGNLGNARSQARQLVAALRAYDAVERLNVEIQDRQTVVLLRMHRTHLGITLGRYAEAFAGCEEAIAHSDVSGTVYDMLEVLHGYASAYNEIEAYSEAERLSRLGLDRSEALSSAPVPSQVLAAAQLKRDLGVALVGLGRHAEGVAVLESVLETLQGSAFAPFRLLTYAELVAALLPTGDQSHFIEPMLALLPVGWTNLRRPEFVYLMCYRLLSAAGRTAEARELIKEGQRLLLETVAQLETQDDVHSYILNVPPNRRLYEALVKEGLLSTELPKPGAASRRPHR